MGLLNPDWEQKKPTFSQARAMCQQIQVETRPLTDSRFDPVLNRLRETHANGGALFASFKLGASEAFEWFASRNRLLEFAVLRQLLDRVEVTSALPELQVQPLAPDDPAFAIRNLKEEGRVAEFLESLKPEISDNERLRLEINQRLSLAIDQNEELGNPAFDGTFRGTDSFLFDGELAGKLYAGGAYTRPNGDGRAEKESALGFCDALFGLRFSEVSFYSTDSAWTSWFGNMGCDWTAILFDRRLRSLSILATTDSD